MVKCSAVALLATVGMATAFQPSFMGAGVKGVAPVAPKTTMSVQDDVKKVLGAGLLSLGVFGSMMNPAQAITKSEIDSLSYLQVKGTGLANRCPEVIGEGSINISGKKVLKDVCIEPKVFQVLEETGKAKGVSQKEFVNTKLMTRQTYTLYGVEGPLDVQDGKITWKETDGIDYAATTVQLPGGERVPFLFTVKNLVAKAAAGGSTIKPGFQFGGGYTVPSYRTGLFLDPKGRGGSTGYDMAVALPGQQGGVEGGDDMFKENNKTFDISDGQIEFEVNRVDTEAGEIGGVFVSKQKGDTDMGSKVPKDMLVKGIFYGRVADAGQ